MGRGKEQRIGAAVALIATAISMPAGIPEFPTDWRFWLFIFCGLLLTFCLGGLFWDWWDSPRKANLRKWRAKREYRIIEAAALWYGFEPVPEHIFGHVLTAEVRRIHIELDDAFGRGEFPNARKDWIDVGGNRVVYHLIPEDDLRAWARSRGEKPRFLFRRKLFPFPSLREKLSRLLLRRNGFHQSADK